MKPLIYLAGPYTHPCQAINVKLAIEEADRLLEEGFIPYIPHLSHFWDIISPKPRTYEFWLDLDYNYILRCDGLYRMPGHSHGADLEVEYALKNGIPVFYGIPEMRKYYEVDGSLVSYRCSSGSG